MDVPGAKFSYWLAKTCRAARDAAGVSQAAVAKRSGVGRSAIHYFETRSSWPRNPEGLVAAYSAEAGFEDSRILWERAMDLWLKHGVDAIPPEEEPPRNPA